MKKIAILGGTFNPPHLGHLIIASEVQAQLNFDEIWFMPNQEPPHKESTIGVNSAQRLEMVRRAVADLLRRRSRVIARLVPWVTEHCVRDEYFVPTNPHLRD